jgi:large subunit ribosomal protein L29
MNTKELREKDITELNATLIDLLKEHFNLRMQHRSSELADSSKLSKTKKTIARVKTIIREKS